MPVSAFAVLGLLSQTPASGYQLAQQVEGAISNFWPMSKSNVYAELIRLEELELVEASDVSQVKLPNKRVFFLTEAGAAALDAWLREPTFRKERRKNSLLVKMLFADRLTPEQVAALVEAARQEATADRDRLAAIVDQLDKLPACAWIRSTALFGLRHAEATLAWADEMRRQFTPPSGAHGAAVTHEASEAANSAAPAVLSCEKGEITQKAPAEPGGASPGPPGPRGPGPHGSPEASA
jgi:DNA-binding PadR family transcriptional regulator